MTALLVGGAGVFPHGASDLRSSSRTHLRRGLAASAALHLLLLAILLRASGGGEAVVRTYLRPAVLLREPVRALPSPAISEATARPSEPNQTDVGVFEPRPTPPEIPLEPFGSVGPSRPPVPGDRPGAPPDGAAFPPGAPAAGPPDEVYRVVDVEPVPTFAPTPVYPPWARDAGITGHVLLHVLVGKDGRVRRVVIEKNENGLGEAARETLARWVFRPARVNGAAVTAWVAIPVHFRL